MSLFVFVFAKDNKKRLGRLGIPQLIPLKQCRTLRLLSRRNCFERPINLERYVPI